MRVYVWSKSFSQVFPFLDNCPLPIIVLPLFVIVHVYRCEKSGAFLHQFKIPSWNETSYFLETLRSSKYIIKYSPVESSLPKIAMPVGKPSLSISENHIRKAPPSIHLKDECPCNIVSGT